jgi:hypothetical protein
MGKEQLEIVKGAVLEALYPGANTPQTAKKPPTPPASAHSPKVVGSNPAPNHKGLEIARFQGLSFVFVGK